MNSESELVNNSDEQKQQEDEKPLTWKDLVNIEAHVLFLT